MSIQELVIVSSPRSGTNFFCECVGALQGAKAYFEILNPAGVFGITDAATLHALNEGFGTQAENAQDKDLIHAFRADPMRGIDILRDDATSRGQSLISYKIFPGQASLEMMGKIFSRENVAVIQIVRQRLDTFISYEKARTKNVWHNKDTTDLLVSVDVDAFLKWARTLDKWHIENSNLISKHDIPRSIWTYKKDINIPKADVVEKIQKFVAQNGVFRNITPKVQDNRFSRQDIRSDPFEKIANGEKLREELNDRGVYDYARSEPLI
ncbi:hypothetical protein DL1_18210 [Thioclava dalianensis]|uniref:Sulphotransferase Stf0 domain-containing protein n=1 Tax=Thioclava dalianensis TaxID=1185766 RepID=A0A074TFV1_9RHOB|nr:hypothetical protein [Thioclava dalianensis]KEP67913.1 hypothetical protein DL1_18210 [Thioclava dalianensis]SFN16570.1 hypothetical protein SAMN05216224_102745 [Thioclava dalianensis]